MQTLQNWCRNIKYWNYSVGMAVETESVLMFHKLGTFLSCSGGGGRVEQGEWLRSDEQIDPLYPAETTSPSLGSILFPLTQSLTTFMHDTSDVMHHFNRFWVPTCSFTKRKTQTAGSNSVGQVALLEITDRWRFGSTQKVTLNEPDCGKNTSS